MNRNCLVPKIDEIPAIAKISNAAVKSITEMKFDNSNNDSEIFIEGYSIIWRDQNKKGGGVYLTSVIEFVTTIKAALPTR